MSSSDQRFSRAFTHYVVPVIVCLPGTSRFWRNSPLQVSSVSHADVIESQNIRLFYVPSRVGPRLRMPRLAVVVLEGQNS